MPKNALFFLLGLTITTSAAYGQDKDSPKADTRESIIDKFQAELRELERAHNEKLDIARKDTVERLQLLRKAVAADDLDEAVKIRNLEDEILKSKPLLAQATSGQKPSNESKMNNKRVDPKETKELKEKIKELEKQMVPQSELARKIVGRSYQIKIGKEFRIWTFSPNGALFINGNVTATRWSAFGNDAVICAGYDNGNIDVCVFTNDLQNIEVIFVGDYKKSKVHHVGVAIVK